MMAQTAWKLPWPPVGTSCVLLLRARYRLLLLSNTNAIHFDLIRANYPILLSVDDLGDGFELKAQTDQRLEPHRIAIDYDRCLVLRWVHRKGRLSIRLASLNFGSSKIADLATIEKGSRLFF